VRVVSTHCTRKVRRKAVKRFEIRPKITASRVILIPFLIQPMHLPDRIASRLAAGYQKLEIVVSPYPSRAPLVLRSVASSGESDPERLNGIRVTTVRMTTVSDRSQALPRIAQQFRCQPRTSRSRSCSLRCKPRAASTVRPPTWIPRAMPRGCAIAAESLRFLLLHPVHHVHPARLAW
jgi:hypothetical protein